MAKLKALSPVAGRNGKLMFTKLGRCTSILGMFFVALPAFAQEAAETVTEAAEASVIDTGDTAWMLMSTTLVIMMTAPALALFYGGLVSQRNVLSTLMHSFFVLCLISVQWVLWGYSLSFGTQNIFGYVGGFDFLLLNGVGPEANGTIPHILFCMFQGTFAVITVALISGAFAERMNFAAFVVFSLLWSTFIYDPLHYWVWGGGWLYQLGALDFAGGTVVHISSGVSALVCAIVIGKRVGYPKSLQPPHNLPFTLIGASLLWVGWFGFNAGSALSANGTAAMAFATTNTAAAAAGLTWVLVEWMFQGKPTLLGAATGAVAGLVAITPGAGFVSISSSLIFGIGVSIICYFGVFLLKPKLGYDDSLDVFGIHGLGGTWGALATGLFAQESIGGVNGLFFGNPGQFMIQLYGVLAGWALAGIGTFIILKIVGVIIPLRVTHEDEIAGLDLTLHGEVGYNFLSPGMTRSLTDGGGHGNH